MKATPKDRGEGNLKDLVFSFSAELLYQLWMYQCTQFIVHEKKKSLPCFKKHLKQIGIQITMIMSNLSKIQDSAHDCKGGLLELL